MTTTVQIQDDTLQLLKKVKEETHAQSYDEAIKKIIFFRVREKSMGGYLSAYASKNTRKDIRDKHDRF